MCRQAKRTPRIPPQWSRPCQMKTSSFSPRQSKHKIRYIHLFVLRNYQQSIEVPFLSFSPRTTSLSQNRRFFIQMCKYKLLVIFERKINLKWNVNHKSELLFSWQSLSIHMAWHSESRQSYTGMFKYCPSYGNKHHFNQKYVYNVRWGCRFSLSVDL